MSEIGFYLTFEAILYGLIATKFLLGWNDLVSNWKSVKFYWAHTLLSIEAFILLMIRFQSRLVSDDYQNIENIYQMVFHIVLGPALLYFVIHQSFPSKNEATDIKNFVKERRLQIFTPLVLFYFISTVDVYLVVNYPLGVLVPALVFLAHLPLLFIRNLRYFEVMVLIVGLYACYAMYVV